MCDAVAARAKTALPPIKPAHEVVRESVTEESNSEISDVSTDRGKNVPGVVL